ncbi:IclR family transcriptional regulator [Streptomyces sp. S07_1.15]|uniref:IclR family transcriptional regulator n=1 Tax=Streptomyces sp. S07_1.15 TaxID=2873925 RepID=UPI001D136DBE|nr:IclR family transcriptional regulator [Streptomyces sp. S07_1.15]MCC3650010.1 IclR family transcriptional regulator [Streptomyces sp. S07_1.15]
MPRPTALPGAARTGPAGGRPEPAGVKSARRAIDLIETFAANDDWLTLGALHAATGLPRSSLHGLLRTLHESGWLETDGGGGYRLGVRALICGTAYLDRDPVIPYATEALETVRDKTGFTAHYARRDGDQVVYLETRESRRSAHLVSRVGRTLPAHATALGKVLLAELTQDEIAGLMPVPLPALTPNTLTTLEALEAACAETRERGYGLETEEGTPGVRCAAAVIPYRIPATDAISCSMPTDQVTEEAVAGVGELLTEVAGDLGRRLRRAGIR